MFAQTPCNPYLKSTNPSSHFVLPMLAPQQYAYLWKARIKVGPKIVQPPKIMAFRGQGSLLLLALLYSREENLTDATDPFRS